MPKPIGQRVSSERRQEKKYRRQQYDYDFKLNAINYYAIAGISATIARFFPSTSDGPRGSKCKLVSKWKQQHAGTATTSGHQRSRDCGLATALPQSTETSIVKRVNDSRRDGVPVPSAIHKIRALEEVEQLKIPLGAFSATWQWQSGFVKRRRFSFRVKTHTRLTAPTDALDQAIAFAHEVARRADVECNGALHIKLCRRDLTISAVRMYTQLF